MKLRVLIGDYLLKLKCVQRELERRKYIYMIGKSNDTLVTLIFKVLLLENTCDNDYNKLYDEINNEISECQINYKASVSKNNYTPTYDELYYHIADVWERKGDNLKFSIDTHLYWCQDIPKTKLYNDIETVRSILLKVLKRITVDIIIDVKPDSKSIIESIVDREVNGWDGIKEE